MKIFAQSQAYWTDQAKSIAGKGSQDYDAFSAAADYSRASDTMAKLVKPDGSIISYVSGNKINGRS